MVRHSFISSNPRLFLTTFIHLISHIMARDMKSNCLFGSKHFLAISGDNRLRLWDIASNKEKRCFVEKQHLSHTYTCFAWGQDVAKKGADDVGVCAVGTSDGLVIIWDLTRGVVVRTLGTAGTTAAPTDIHFSSDLKTIFTCSSENVILEYSVSTGESKQVIKGFKKGALRLAVSGKILAAASGTVKLFGAGGLRQKLDASFPSGGVSVMAFSNCGQYLACAGAGAREVVLFGLRGSLLSGREEEGGGLAPLCVCPVSGSPRQLVLAVTPGGKAGDALVDVVCVLPGPAAGCVLRVQVPAAGGGQATVAGVVPFAGLDASCAVLGASFSSSSGSVTLATGQISAPRFVTLPYAVLEDGASMLLGAVTLPPSTLRAAADKANGVVSERSEGMEVEAEVSILGPHENGGAKRPLVSDSAEEGPSEKRLKARSADKLTVEQRLNSAAAALLKLESKGAAGAGQGKAASAATTDSLVTLVEQALQAGDDGLLEQCLECAEADVVAETSRRLPTRLVVPLLRRLVAKFEKKPARGALLTRWIHGLLRCHMSYLLSVPDLAQQLAALSQMLEQRLSTYSRLASLAGRLDLLLAQVSSSSAPAPAASAVGQQDAEQLQQPSQVYYED